MLRFRLLRSSACIGLCLLLLASCSSTPDISIDDNLPPHMQLGYDSKGKPVRNYKVGTPYEVAGKWYYPAEDYSYREEGIASWYGPGFHGKRTANGEIYDMNAITAAHKTLPMPSVVKVINLENSRSMLVRINDRGPFVDGRIIDLSRRTAQLLGVEKQGTARVLVEFVPDDSLTLKNWATNASMDLRNSKQIPKAAPREPVVSEPIASPSAAVSGQQSGLLPVDQRGRAIRSLKTPQIKVQRPSIASNSAQRAVSETSVQAPRVSTTGSEAMQRMPTRTAASPSSSVVESRLSSPQMATRTVTAKAPSTGVSVGAKSGFQMPSVDVSASDIASAARSAIESKGNLKAVAKEVLPSPRDMLEKAIDTRERVRSSEDIVATSRSPQSQVSLEPQSQVSLEPQGQASIEPQQIARLAPPEDIRLPVGVFIQAGSFEDISNARRLEAQLSELGNVFVAMVDVEGEVFHRVRVGPILDNSVAAQLLQYMQTEGYAEARIVSE